MKVFSDFSQIHTIQNPVITIGTFDGVHLGHQKIISYLNQKAQEIDGESVLFTFYPHPRMVLDSKNHGIKLIQTQQEKLAKLEQIGLQNCIVYPFTYEFSQLSAHDFVAELLVNQLHVKHLVIGYDHHFGKDRSGNIDFLKKMAPQFGFSLTEISAEDINEVNVSSTKIRKAIKTGDIETANQFLGSLFVISGKVIQGKQLGRKFGFPTANIKLENQFKLLPPDGVYVVKVKLKHENHWGILSIGTNPTVSLENQRTIEVFIIDFHQDIYHETLQVELLHFIRRSEKFDSVDLLIQQMKNDEAITRDFMATHIH